MFNSILIFKMLRYDWISIVIISIFALLALNNFMYEKRFRALILGFFNNQYFSNYKKYSPLIVNTFNIIFLPINLFSFGLIFFYFAKHYFPGLFPEYDFKAFLTIIILFLLYYLLKGIISLLFNSILFNIKNSREFLFYKISFRNLTSIIMLILIALHQFSSLPPNITLLVLISVFATFYVFGYLFSSYQIVEKNNYSIYHIILYLCALEIAPSLIYVKFAILMLNVDF